MGTTANGLRYPALADAPNVPLDMQELAEDLDGAPVLHSTGTTSALSLTAPVLPAGVTAYVGLTVVNINTADPCEIKQYRCMDTSPATWLTQDWNEPWGFIDRQLATAASAGTGTTTPFDIPGATKSVALRKNRRYRVGAFVLANSTVANDYVQLILNVNAVGLGGAVNSMPVANLGIRINYDDTFDFTTASGSYTVKLQLVRNFGTGTIGHRSDIDQARFVLYDVGPSGIPSA